MLWGSLVGGSHPPITTTTTTPQGNPMLGLRRIQGRVSYPWTGKWCLISHPSTCEWKKGPSKILTKSTGKKALVTFLKKLAWPLQTFRKSISTCERSEVVPEVGDPKFPPHSWSQHLTYQNCLVKSSNGKSDWKLKISTPRAHIWPIAINCNSRGDGSEWLFMWWDLRWMSTTPRALTFNPENGKVSMLEELEAFYQKNIKSFRDSVWIQSMTVFCHSSVQCFEPASHNTVRTRSFRWESQVLLSLLSAQLGHT